MKCEVVEAETFFGLALVKKKANLLVSVSFFLFEVFSQRDAFQTAHYRFARDGQGGALRLAEAVCL